MSTNKENMTASNSKKQSAHLQHQFLLSMPQLLDPNFNATLTYICEHDEYGAMGITLNRPSELTLYELFDQLEIPYSDEGKHKSEGQLIYLGGPVQQDRGFILHTDLRSWQSTLEINEHMRLTSSKDILEAIAKGEGPENYIIVLGYAGWSEGQLEAELLANAWLSCPADAEILFHTPYSNKFNQAMNKLGIDSSQLNGQIGHA